MTEWEINDSAHEASRTTTTTCALSGRPLHLIATAPVLPEGATPYVAVYGFLYDHGADASTANVFDAAQVRKFYFSREQLVGILATLDSLEDE